MALGGRHRLLPGGAKHGGIQQVIGAIELLAQIRKHGLKGHETCCRGFGLADTDRDRVLAGPGLRVAHLRQHAHVHGVIRHAQKVQRPVELHLETGRMIDGLAQSIDIGRVRRGARPEDEGVEGELRVHVQIAEVGVAGGVPLNPGRRRGSARRVGLRGSRFISSRAPPQRQGEQQR